MTHEQIVENSRAIALDSVPSGGSEFTDAIVQIFKANPGSHFSGKEIEALFAEQSVEIKNASSVLAALRKDGVLSRPKVGWYTYAQ